MARRKTGTTGDTGASSKVAEVTGRGIRTGFDFINLMSAVMDDLANGRITSANANAMCNAGGKMLKCAEMQAKHGRQQEGHVGRVLELAQMAGASDSIQ